MKDFGPIFEKNEFNELLMRTKWDHAIELKEDNTPFTSKIYPLSKDKQRKLMGLLKNTFAWEGYTPQNITVG